MVAQQPHQPGFGCFLADAGREVGGEAVLVFERVRVFVGMDGRGGRLETVPTVHNDVRLELGNLAKQPFLVVGRRERCVLATEREYLGCLSHHSPFQTGA